MGKLRYAPRKAMMTNGHGQWLRPVFGLDIDGTLGQYHEHFTSFAEQWLGRELPHNYEGVGSFPSFLGLSKSTYRKVKLAYRRGGLKRSMPTYEGAAQLARKLRAAGALVVICTTRPYLSIEAIEPDTAHWLRRNEIQHDGILSGEHKYRDLSKLYGSRVVAVLDDLPELVRQADSVGLVPLLVSRPHNQFSSIGTGWSVSSLWHAGSVMIEMLREWEEKRIGS